MTATMKRSLGQRKGGIVSTGLVCGLLLLAWPAGKAAWAQVPKRCTFDSDIVVMIDVSGSVQDDVLANIGTAVRTLLASLALNDPRPRVAIGAFSGGGQILGGADLTDDYATPGSGPLYSALTRLSRISPSGTMVSAGLLAAKAELGAHGIAGTQDYIVLISDGCCNDVDNATAIAVRNAIAAAGVKFYAIQVFGVDDACRHPEVFMRDQIASGDEYYYWGGTDLVGIADIIALRVWSCDDNPCTEDSCGTDGNCLHTALEGLYCNFGNPCTGGVCDASGNCVLAVLEGAACDAGVDDGNPCTGGVCDAQGNCSLAVLAGAPCNNIIDDGNPCTEGVCEANGNCVSSNVPDGASCEDGLFCNGVETCIEGICTDGADPCLATQTCDERIDYCANCDPDELPRLTASDAAAGDEFGVSVAVSGETAVIGAHKDDSLRGSAYVFVRAASGSWTRQGKLIASDAAAEDYFGLSVAVSGDIAVVGAYGDDDAGDQSGSAYVFVRSGSVWSQQAKLTASDAAAGDYFGTSVAVSGETALIGANGDDEVGQRSGAAYVFVQSEGIWSQQAKLTASDATALDRFGYSVAVSGNTAIIGADEDCDAGDKSGSAYVFTRDGTGSWTQQAKLNASDAAAYDHFGSSVAVSGYTTVIGAPSGDRGCGTAYVFTRDPSGSWTQQAKLTASDAAVERWFGCSVTASGDLALIGAATWWNLAPGSAYVFTRDTSGLWKEQTKLIAWHEGLGNSFGYSVAVSGEIAVVGAHGDHSPATRAGSAYVFDLSSCQSVCAHGPVLVDQPSGRAVCEGETVVFQADATGTGQVTYQWQHDGELIPGATTDRYTIDAADQTYAGDYAVVVSDDCGSVSSDAATLTVYALPQPVITATPAASVCGPTKITLNAGPGYASYLWSPGGQTGQTITVWAAGRYTVKVIDEYGCEGSDVLFVTVLDPEAFGDADHDCDVDLTDYTLFGDCLTGPVGAAGFIPASEACAAVFDANTDTDVDLADFASFQAAFTGG